MSFLHVLMYIYKKSEKFNSQHIIIILYLYYIWIKKKEFSSTSSVFLKDKLYFIFHLPPSSLPASVSVLQIQHEKNNITWPFWINYQASWLLCTQRKNGSFIVILDQDFYQTSLCLRFFYFRKLFKNLNPKDIQYFINTDPKSKITGSNLARVTPNKHYFIIRICFKISSILLK